MAFALKFALIIIALLALLVVTQDAQIFPVAVTSLIKQKGKRHSPLPKDIKSVFLESGDSKIEIWKFSPSSSKSRKIAILIHGNGDTVDTFYHVQEMFASIGISSYSFDFKGYGHSSGWPSEWGVYEDSEAVLEYVTKEEGISPEDLVIVGYSLGSSAAARLAQKYGANTLILYAPFTSLKDVVRDRPFLRILKPFVRYEFPTIRYVSGLTKTRLIIAHGEKDTVVPFHHSLDLVRSYKGETIHTVYLPNADHLTIITESWNDVKKSLKEGTPKSVQRPTS
ncbi:MAG: alpha/beta fold hydrolase [Candidatus Dadabacteria bacterium]|nr:MAG: alpha/beta fold hydrolase [Candidatus Dadabacteria bacterium]